MMKRLLLIIFTLVLCLPALAQRAELRSGNRAFRKGDFPRADVEYRKAMLRDSSLASTRYNLANTLYREKDAEAAMKMLEGGKEAAEGAEFEASYYYNLGDAAIQAEKWQEAVDALKKSLKLNPDDVAAKENYVYARNKLLQQQQQQQNQDQQGDGDGKQDQDQQNQDQNDQKDQQDQNKDQQQNQDQQQNEDKQESQPQPQEAELSPQQAQQLLQAIQQKERETQEKVDEKKAQALKSRQKEKNW